MAADGLFRQESTGHWPTAVFGYLAVFFALWWGWVNFTWFASAFDTDDWLYRVTTIVQMGGVLVVAGGIRAAFHDDDFRLIVVGYIVMRLAMVAQWLRAARAPEYRATALRYAGAIAAVQVLWVLRLLVPVSSVAAQAATFVVLAGLELLVPAWAERSRRTPFNPRHIGERYGLFTLIVLGEGLLSVTHALIEAADGGERSGGLVLLGATVALFLLATWLVVLRPSLGAPANRAVPVLAVLAGAAALLPGGVQWCATAVVTVVAVLEVDQRRAHRGAGSAA